MNVDMSETRSLLCICSVCKKVLDVQQGHGVSDGLCDTCAKKEEEKFLRSVPWEHSFGRREERFDRQGTRVW